MAFVRTKKVGEHRYYQVVENVREDGKHRQRVLLHLGTYTLAGAYHYWGLFRARYDDYAEKYERLQKLLDEGKVEIDPEDLRGVEEESARRRARRASER